MNYYLYTLISSLLEVFLGFKSRGEGKKGTVNVRMSNESEKLLTCLCLDVFFKF